MNTMKIPLGKLGERLDRTHWLGMTGWFWVGVGMVLAIIIVYGLGWDIIAAQLRRFL